MGKYKYIITSSGDIRFEIELTNQENISVIDRMCKLICVGWV